MARTAAKKVAGKKAASARAAPKKAAAKKKATAKKAAAKKTAGKANKKVALYASKIAALNKQNEALIKKRNALEMMASKIAFQQVQSLNKGDRKRAVKFRGLYESQMKKATALQVQIGRVSAAIGKLGLLADKSSAD